MNKKCRAFTALLLGAGLLMSACGNTKSQEADTSEVIVDAMRVNRGNLVLSNQFVGSVSPEDSVYIIPMAQGTVTETFFEVGDTVQAGDILFQIDDTAAQLQLKQAQLSLTSTAQQANSALTTQQDSANLQLDTSYSNAFQAYQTLQLQYYKLADAKDQAEDAVEKVEEQIEQLKAAAGSVSGGDAVVIAAQIKLLEEGGETPDGIVMPGLAELKSLRTQARDAFDSITVQYESAERSLKLLEDTKSLTQGAALNDTKAQLNTGLQLAGLGVESAELALSYYQVDTPIAGTVISKNVTVNSFATPSSPAYVIANEDTMTVTYQVSESIRNTLRTGMEISVERNGAVYEGVITEVANAVNMQTGLFQIKATVYADGTSLPSGVSVKITSDTYTAEEALLIPYDAVYYDNEGSYVYVLENNCASKTYVTTGIFNDEQIEIVDGLTIDHVVITSWSPRLLDGVLVDAKIAEASGK